MIRIPGVIPITIHPFFWLLAAMIGWFSTQTVFGTLIWVGIILISVTIHELGHALTALAWGQKASIDLVAFGGVTQREGGRLKLWKEFLVIFNGPLAGFLFCALCWWLFHKLQAARPDSTLPYLLFITYYVNLFWTIVNLLPIQPLDGGKLLSILLESVLGVRGMRLSFLISIVFSGLVSLYFFSMSSFLAGSLFFLLAFESWYSWKNSRIVSDQDQNLILQHLLNEGERELSLGSKQEALTKFLQIRELAKSGVIYLTASEYAAGILTDLGDLAQAYQILLPLKDKLSPNGLCLLHQLSYRQGHWDQVALLGDKVYQTMPHYEVALMNAISHSLLGHVRPAIGWLGCTIRDGLPNVPQVLARKEFDPIRSDPLFPKFGQ